ncbi:MAG: cupin domain-containing protein [Acidobacteriota bacterium]|nr:cupin domain-containing protein [Acidobacteriota bacterium]
MRLLVGIFVIASAWAQTPGGATIKTFASSAQIQDLIANAKRIHKPGQPLVSQPIVRFAPYVASLEYRTAVGPAAVHETESEMFYVIEGAGTLVTGGKLVNAERKNSANVNGTAIEGGTSQAVAKGDMIMVPPNTPHWYSKIEGTLILMSIHLPKQ